MLIVFLLLIGGFGYLFYATGYIIFAYGDEYEKKIVNRRNIQIDTALPAMRGDIKDRNGEYLAKSVQAYNLVFDIRLFLEIIDGMKIEDSKKEAKRKEYLNKLTQFVDYTEAELEVLIKENPKSAYRVLRRTIPTKEAMTIKEAKIIGVWLEETADRIYPNDYLAAQVIGFEGGGVGRNGIEQSYDRWLQGTPGRRLMVPDGGGLTDMEYIAPLDGNDLVLTIDETIQHFVEAAMLKQMEVSQPLNASAIVMKPDTGEILAMASYPTFNLNDRDKILGYYGKNIGELTDQERTNLLFKTWRNYNVSATYEVGSTFKPLTYAMALEHGLTTTEEKFVCTGKKVIYGVSIGCWKKAGHGEMTMVEALADSCNVATMELASRLGRSVFYNYLKAFGYAKETQIDVIGEPQDYSRVTYSEEQLNPVELATTSFGQGPNLTPIQLMMANAAIINGGELLQPRLVRQIVDKNGIVVKDMKKKVVRKVISKETSDTMRKAMEETVNYGTGKKLQIPGYKIGAKTGTAEKGDRNTKDYIVSVLSYAPVEDPKVMMLVILDQGNIRVTSGMAAEISKEIYKNILPRLEIYPNISTPN